MSDIPSNSNLYRYITAFKWRETLPFAIIAFTCVEGILDSTTPRRLSDWMLFMVPILLTSWLSKRWTINVTIAATIFTIVGFFLPLEPIPTTIMLVFPIANRAIGISIFWITALLINLRRKALADIQRVNIELEQKAQRILEAEKLKTEFLADTSHELRAPLAIAKSHLDLALGRKSKRITDPYKSLRAINIEIKHIAGIISDLIILARVAEPARPLLLDEIYLKELIAKIIKKYAQLASSKHITVKSNLPEIIYRGDEEKLTKLFSNLFVNAVQYGKEKGHIEIVGRKEWDAVVIEFKDDGIGIPENDIPYIFERFYRVEKARARDSGGVGLGLAICKWVTDAHGGSIMVSSVLNEGSVFTVTLPLSNQNSSSPVAQSVVPPQNRWVTESAGV